MEFLTDLNWQLRIMRALVPALAAILFAQSGLDKVFDFRGNLEWLTGHFSKTPLRGIVKPSLVVITAGELLAAGVCAVGAIFVLAGASTTPAFWGLAVSAATLLALFTGQRIAKDYAGAASIAMYVGIVALGMFLLR